MNEIITTIADLAKAADGQTAPKMVDIHGIPHLLSPKGDAWEVRSYQDLIPEPKRLTGRVKLHTPGSFLDYVNAYKGARSVAIYADRENSRWTAVFDHLTSEAPGWAKHRAAVSLEKDQDFIDWTAKNKKWMSQVEFAEFLEDHLSNVQSPAPAEMLDLITDFKAAKSVDYQSTKLLRNGKLSLVWAESVTESREIPLTFTIAFRVYRHSDHAYEAKARLRYRIDDQKQLKWFFIIDRLNELEDKAWENECEAFNDDAVITWIPLVFNGTEPDEGKAI